MIATTTTNWPLPEDAEHADAKAELWALLSHEAGADERIETALWNGTFSGLKPRACAYGHALGSKLQHATDSDVTRSVLGLRYEITGWNRHSPLESFVFGIFKGSTPLTSPRAATVVRWIHEWQASR